MTRVMTGIVVLAAVLSGCDEEDPADAGSDAGPMTMDGGGDMDAGPGDTDAGADAGEGAPLGAQCTESAECESRSCTNPVSAVEIGTGFCTHTCSGDADCSDLPTDDGHTYECIAESALVSRCHRTCVDGFGCPEGSWCLNDFSFQTTSADICLDFRNDLCRSNGDCEDPERCTLLIDRERAYQVCFAPRAMDLSPLPFRTVGEACDPAAQFFQQPCDTAADCATGYLCEENGAGQQVCLPPLDERCHLLCILPGVCTGVCDTDADCPTEMRCTQGEFNYIGHTNGVFDDEAVGVGFCTYATGSRTACDAEEDCASTGAGGAREVCWPTGDATDPTAHICVTPPAGLGLEGDACGDDPTTDGTREPRFCAGGTCVARSCGGVCETTADCPTDWDCVDSYLDATTTTRYCVDAQDCTDDAGCSAGEICQGIVTDATGYRRVCITPSGALGAGEMCDASLPVGFADFADTCETFCFDLGEGAAAARCTEMCTADSDCPGADWVCGRFSQTIANGGTYPDRTDDVVGSIDVCLHQPGSRSACTLNPDCGADERCVALVDQTGTTQRVCVTAVAGGGEPGDACAADDPCIGRACITRWFDPGAGFCSAFCAADADCPTDFVCRRANLDNPMFMEAICMPMDDPRGLPL